MFKQPCAVWQIWSCNEQLMRPSFIADEEGIATLSLRLEFQLSREECGLVCRRVAEEVLRVEFQMTSYSGSLKLIPFKMNVGHSWNFLKLFGGHVSHFWWDHWYPTDIHWVSKWAGFTSDVAHGNLLVASMAAKLTSSMYVRAGIDAPLNQDLLCCRQMVYRYRLSYAAISLSLNYKNNW